MTHCTITDKEYNEVKISISNALNSVEEPAKSNLLRDAIIATYHTNGGHAFWDIAIRNPLHDNRVVAWKFCHVVHKLLIDGHPLFIQHSMRHRNLITDIGRNEKELYGEIIRHGVTSTITEFFPFSRSFRRWLWSVCRTIHEANCY